MATKKIQIVGSLNSTAVQFVEQDLTDEQKAQARENIGVAGSGDVDLSDYYTKDEVDLAIAENSANIELDVFPTQGSKNPVESSGIHMALTALENKMTSTFCYKGTKENYSDLPSTGNSIGDVWNILNYDPSHNIESGDNVAWDGEKWDVLAGIMDLSGYYTKAEIDNIALTGEVNLSNYYTKSETYNKTEIDSALENNSVEWENIDNKPFEDTRIMSVYSYDKTPNPVSFDNELMNYSFYKVSDLMLTKDEIFNTKFVINGYEPEKFSQSNVLIETDGFIVVQEAVENGWAFAFCNTVGVCNFTFSGYPLSVDVPEVGIYRICAALGVGMSDCSTVEIYVGGELKTLDPKFISDMYYDTRKMSYYSQSENPNPISFDSIPLNYTFYKVSDMVLTREEILSTKIQVNDRILRPKESDILVETNELITLSITNDGYIDGFLFANTSGTLNFTFSGYPLSIDVPENEPGIYYVMYLGDAMPTDVTIDILVSGELKQIDPKFIPINLSLSDYYTKSDVYTKSEINNKFNNEVYTKWEVDNKISNLDLSNYYTKSETYTRSEINNKISSINLSNYYTKSEVDNKVSIDLSNYYTKSQVYTKSDVYTKSEVNNRINSAISSIDTALSSLVGSGVLE